MTGLPFTRKGSGPLPVVFLHGYCEGSWVWEKCLPEPGPRFSFFCFDLPGFGASVNLPDTVSMEWAARVVFHSIREFSDAPPVVIGHSLGGYVALAMAAQGVGMISGLGLFHSTALPDSEEKKLNREKVAASVMEYGARPFLENFAGGLFANADSVPCLEFSRNCAGTRPETIAAWALAMRDRPDRSMLLSGLEIPLLFIAGRYDTLTPVEMMEKQSKSNIRSRFVVLENSAHAGMLEQPGETAEILREFLVAIP